MKKMEMNALRRVEAGGFDLSDFFSFDPEGKYFKIGVKTKDFVWLLDGTFSSGELNDIDYLIPFVTGKYIHQYKTVGVEIYYDTAYIPHLFRLLLNL